MKVALTVRSVNQDSAKRRLCIATRAFADICRPALGLLPEFSPVPRIERTHRLFESGQITCNCHHESVGAVLGFADCVFRCPLRSILIYESSQRRKCPAALLV